MGSKQDFIKYFMGKINFPNEAQETFGELYKQIESEPQYTLSMNDLINIYMNKETEIAYEGVDELAEKMEVHSYTMSMMFFILAAEPLLEKYHTEGIAEDIFWDTMKDLYCKLMECYQVYGIWGIFVRFWYPEFYQMTRFALGRLQYEYTDFELNEYEINGNVVKKGDKVINMHIPSNGSFSKEKRLDSYKRAFEFYKKDFNGNPIPMVCESWLLYPEHKEFLPEHLNIRSFMEDFTYIKGETEEVFENAWRVFGKDCKSEPKDLPQETTLQKAYANHLMKGGKTGWGYGVFLFDGEKIIQPNK